MRRLLLLAGLAGCGGNDRPSVDAGIDAASITLTCDTYCKQIQANCQGANQQYGSMDQCTQACASFPVGTSAVTDTTGNTLGCRIHYAAAASTTPAPDCPHAGPAGDVISSASPGACSGGDVCTSFCTLEIMACGTVIAPLSGNPRDSTGNPLFQYHDPDNCVNLCHLDFDKTHNYSTTAMGDSLACRLSAAVTAAVSLDSEKLNCRNTADNATGPCVGTASP